MITFILKLYSAYGVTSVTFAISLVFVLLFEAPFSQLQKLLLGGTHIVHYSNFDHICLCVSALMGGGSGGKKSRPTKTVAENGKTNGHA